MSKRTSPLIAFFVLMSLILAYQSAAAQGDSEPAGADATAAASASTIGAARGSSLRVSGVAPALAADGVCVCDAS